MTVAVAAAAPDDWETGFGGSEEGLAPQASGSVRFVPRTGPRRYQREPGEEDAVNEEREARVVLLEARARRMRVQGDSRFWSKKFRQSLRRRTIFPKE